MITGKQVRLFEGDFDLKGKHATWMKFLVDEAKLYPRYLDVFLHAAVLGFTYDIKRERDEDSTDRARIYADAFINNKADCLLIYRLITLLDIDNLSVDERLDRAFRLDSVPERGDELQACKDKFLSYVLGGIEYMHDTFIEGCTSQDDYIKATCKECNKLHEKMQGASYEDKIARLLGK